MYADDPYWAQPSIWGGLSMMSERTNPLLQNGEYAFFMAMEAGQVLARVLTGTDEAYNAATRARAGYFALFDCLPRLDAARAVLEAAIAFQRELGSEVLLGPRPPCFYDLGTGVLVRGFDGPSAPQAGYHPPHVSEFLEACGFEPWIDHCAYRFDPGALDGRAMRALARRAMERFHFGVEHARLANRRRTCELAYRVMRAGERPVSYEAFCAFFGKLCPLCADDLFLFAMADGEPVGLLIALPEGRSGMRVMTLWVVPAWRNRAVPTALLAALLDAARARGIERVDASTIRADHLASRLCAERAGGVWYRTYRQYQLNLIDN